MRPVGGAAKLTILQNVILFYSERREEMEKLFELKEINPADPNDERGPTYNWVFPDGRTVVLYFRRKGSRLGGHYHKGEDPSKNPERFFIVKGRMKALFIGPNNERKEEILEERRELTIYPNVPHYLEVLEDTILAESRITPFDPGHPDTYLP